MSIELGGLAVAITGALIALHFNLTRDLREQLQQAQRERDDMEKRYLASEQTRETVMHENIDLIKDFIGSDRAYRELKDENDRLKRTFHDQA